MATLCRDCRIHLQDSVPQVFRDMRTADPFEPCQLCGDTSLSGDSKDCPQAIIERSYVDIGDNTRLILITEVLPETGTKSKVSVVRRQLVQPQPPGGAR